MCDTSEATRFHVLEAFADAFTAKTLTRFLALWP
jgi:hypothetical protein